MTYPGQPPRHVASAPLPAALRFGLLGPLAFWRDGLSVRIAAAKHRSVLMILLLNADRTVHMDTLVDELWPDAPPGTARKTVQGYVWRLRQILGPYSDLLTTVGSGYRMVVPDDALDVLEFDRSVSAARTAFALGAAEEAVVELTQALSLWRGPALSCVPRTPIVEAYAVRLNEAHLAAQELLIEARLHLGDHAAVIPDLAGLAAAHPHRESLHRNLMIAFHSTGRRMDAIETFLRLRKRLTTDYGLEPDRETAALHQSILQGTQGRGRTPAPAQRGAAEVRPARTRPLKASGREKAP